MYFHLHYMDEKLRLNESKQIMTIRKWPSLGENLSLLYFKAHALSTSLFIQQTFMERPPCVRHRRQCETFCPNVPHTQWERSISVHQNFWSPLFPGTVLAPWQRSPLKSRGSRNSIGALLSEGLLHRQAALRTQTQFPSHPLI